jgi:hypothetical protein
MTPSKKDFAATYANMSDDELTRLSTDRGTLLPEAVMAFDAEVSRRHLGYLLYYKQPVNEAETRHAAFPAKVKRIFGAVYKPVELVGSVVGRMTWGQRLSLLVCLCVVAAYATHLHRMHEQEVAQKEASIARAVADMADLESAIERFEAGWQATDAWEDQISSGVGGLAAYTADLQAAIVTGNPLIFYGNVLDVRSNDGQSDSTILVKVHGRKSTLRLQLSLKASSQLANRIESNRSFGRAYGIDLLSKACVFVATIDNVERVNVSDKEGDDLSYFVASGTLHDAYASRVYVRELPH